MSFSSQETTLFENIQYNCDISDARDHGVYSMCSMVLKLRNLYKWEQGVEPWDEPEPGDLLDWIEQKENYWADIAGEPYRPLMVESREQSPYDLEAVNGSLVNKKIVYGAGYGRSLKAIFYLARELDRWSVEDCPVVLLGEEKAKEMASPFAMVQDGVIIIRRESLRFFFWDQVQELRSSSRSSLRYAYEQYGLMTNGSLDQEQFKVKLDSIVDGELDLFIYHEVGEILQKTLDSETLQTIIRRFPGSVMEFLCRALKDVLADTHPRGVLSLVIREQRSSTLGFYVGFLDGLREKLFPEMAEGWQRFHQSGDWQHIESARVASRENNLQRAEKIRHLAGMLDQVPDHKIMQQFKEEILDSLGLDAPQ
jgi:hypothetical protein